jgi:hypothetical protein
VRGSLEVASHYIAGDPVAPPALLRARLKLLAGVSLGLAIVSSRQRLGSVAWDPERQALVTRTPAHSATVPKLFLGWSNLRFSVIAGTFRIGFGERLTLDNTRRDTPDGFHPDDVLQRDLTLSRFCDNARIASGDACGASYAARDFHWQEGFRGVAASVREVPLGAQGALDLHAFVSYQPRSLYQYELFDRERCTDPRADDEPCRAPPVLESTTGGQLAYVTLPDAFDELAAGGHASLALTGLGRIGVTGYAASPRWRIGDGRLDFQESADYPSGGAFGAVGVDANARLGPWRLSVEAARSIDRLANGGGGFGAVQRSVLSAPDGELELTFRYFDARFVNPHARPVSAPDEMEGQRARNEAGVRLQYWHQAGAHWRFAASADLWVPPEPGAAPGIAPPALSVAARTEYARASPLSVALWASHTRGLAGAGDSACAAESSSEDRCGRERSRAGARVTVAALGPLAELSFQCAYAWGRDTTDKPWTQSLSAWMEASANVSTALRLRFRTHYEAFDPSWAASLEAGWSPVPLLSARSRYETQFWLDFAAGTPAHRRNPEHRFRLELEARF